MSRRMNLFTHRMPLPVEVSSLIGFVVFELSERENIISFGVS